MTVRDFGLTLTRRDDGTLGAKGLFDMSGLETSKMPNLTIVDLDGNFDCRDNELRSLAGLPRTITGHIDCRDNPYLEVLGDAPDNVKIISDYGTFASKADLPPELARTFREHLGSVESTVMRKPVSVGPSISFKKKT
jgi:hypothetical protein